MEFDAAPSSVIPIMSQDYNWRKGAQPSQMFDRSVATLFLLFVIVPVTAQNTGPKIVSSFDATSGDPGMTYKDHPDIAMAACSNCGKAGQVLVATGQDVAVYDKSGKLLKSSTMTNFIKAAGLEPDRINDPRAAYDPFIGRWIVVCSCSADFLMVSRNKDATGAWQGVILTGSEGDLTMFPGWDKNGVYIADFQYPLNSRVIALPGADVAWTNKKQISRAHMAIFTLLPYELRPALDPNPAKKPGNPEYLVARDGPPQRATNHAMNLLVEQITWSGKQAAISGPVTIPTGFLYNTPISVAQPSGLNLRGAESHRVFSVAERSGDLYVVEASGPCVSGCGTQGADTNNIFFWFDIDTASMTVKQKAKVVDPALSFLFPTLAVDGRGDVAIGLTGSSHSQDPSVYLYTHLATDPAGKTDGPFLVHAGTTSYSCSKSRLREPNAVGWGTYSATVQDGSDPMMIWTAQEYGGSSTSCEWKIGVAGFRVGSN